MRAHHLPHQAILGFFAKRGCRLTIVGYEFGIDTGAASPVFYRKPRYGPRESDFIMYQIQNLPKNDWIEECAEPWGSQIVISPKTHQDHTSNIYELIWRMCVY